MIGGPVGGRGMIGAVLAAAARQGGASYAAKVLSYSPLAYWKLDETSGSVAADSSGGGYDAAYSGVTLNGETGPDGGAAPSFDGANDYVNTYSAGLAAAWSAAMLSAGTVLAWFKVSAAGDWTDGVSRRVLQVRSAGGSQMRFNKQSTSNTLRFLVETTSGTQTYDKSSYAPTAWVCAALNWSAAANQARYFLDGVLAGTDGSIGAWATGLNTTLNTIGAAGTAGSEPWKGAIAHVAFFPGALSDAAIADLAVV